MKFEELKLIAEKYMSDYEIKECTDIGDKYAFSFGNKGDDMLPPGLPIICVNKETGKISELTIPPIENLDILGKGTNVPLN